MRSASNEVNGLPVPSHVRTASPPSKPSGQLIDQWKVSSRGRIEDDRRHALKLYPRDNYSSHGEWPEEEDLDFYLAIQGLCEVAGILLQNRPVVERYDEDEETGESEYTRFLQWHMPTRDDGRWLSDRRDPVPATAQIDSNDPMGLGTGGYDPHWIYQISFDRFREELFPSPDEVVVWGYRSVDHYSRNERVSITSALVAPDTAQALLRALQTSPDKHAYRIPDTTDETYSSRVPGFELTGWIEPHGYDYGRDRQDPYAKSIDYPPIRPMSSIPPLDSLVPDADLRLWRDAKSIAVISIAWDDSDKRQSTGSSGQTLVFNRSWLARMLDKFDRWLILEVEIQRRSDDTSSRRSKLADYEERLGFSSPYTKYFLIDSTGEAHEF